MRELVVCVWIIIMSAAAVQAQHCRNCYYLSPKARILMGAMDRPVDVLYDHPEGIPGTRMVYVGTHGADMKRNTDFLPIPDSVMQSIEASVSIEMRKCLDADGPTVGGVDVVRSMIDGVRYHAFGSLMSQGTIPTLNGIDTDAMYGVDTTLIRSTAATIVGQHYVDSAMAMVDTMLPLPKPYEGIPCSAVVRPDGRVEWGGWQFRIRPDRRFGLCIDSCQRRDGATWRSLWNRLMLADLVVQYNDTSSASSARLLFDIRDYGVAHNMVPFMPGHDVPVKSILIPDRRQAVLQGIALPPSSIAIYEEVDGAAFRYHDHRSGEGYVLQNRILVVAYQFSVGNYLYQVRYRFSPDGSFRGRIDLCGQLYGIGRKGRALSSDPDDRPYWNGEAMYEGIMAPVHQHRFRFYADLDVAGTANHVELRMTENKPAKTHENPRGSTVTVDDYAVRRSDDMQGLLARDRSGMILIRSNDDRNRTGRLRGYRIHADQRDTLMLPLEQRGVLGASGINSTFRVTKWRTTAEWPDERVVAPWGDSPIQTRDDDIVVWIGLGLTHVPTLEEALSMYPHRVEFRLIPDGFHDLLIESWKVPRYIVK